MNIKNKITMLFNFFIRKIISKCYYDCPYFELDTNVMICGHPNLKTEYTNVAIISHPECDVGFPEKCPLLNK